MQLKFESTLWVSTTPLVNGVHCKSVLCVYMISLVLPRLGSNWLSQPSRAVLSQAEPSNRLMTITGSAWLTSRLKLAEPIGPRAAPIWELAGSQRLAGSQAQSALTQAPARNWQGARLSQPEPGTSPHK